MTAGHDPLGAWAADFRTLILAGRFPEAEKLLTRHRDDGPPAARLEFVLRQRWGFTLLDQGDAAAAEAQLAVAADLAPQDVEARADLAFAQLRGGRHQIAAATLQEVLRLDPNHRGALTNLGAAWMVLKQFEAAEKVYGRLLELEPGNGPAVRNLGILLNSLERYDEALHWADVALAAGPNPLALTARATALYELGRYDESIEACRQATAAGGDAYELLTREGLALNAMGRVDAAGAALDAAVALRPGAHLAPHRRAPLRLATGDFRGGWQDYEARWRDDSFVLNAAGPVARSLQARFTPEPTIEGLVGRRILVVGEQGIGDELMFASALPDLARDAAGVVCACDRRLLRLFAASMPSIIFVTAGDPRLAADYDVILPAGSLGRLYRNDGGAFPGTPYLRPSAAAIERWAARLGPPPPAGRIGVSWRGGTPRTRRSRRSIALPDMLAALGSEDRAFVSLQYGDVAEDLAAARAAPEVDLRSFGPSEIDDFEDLAALVANLDGVVTVQTALVHLAGAMGARCLTLVPKVAEWRYMAGGASMPWYGSVRLLRQDGAGDWAPVLAEAARTIAIWGDGQTPSDGRS